MAPSPDGDGGHWGLGSGQKVGAYFLPRHTTCRWLVSQPAGVHAVHGVRGWVLWCVLAHSHWLLASAWAPGFCRAYAWGVMCPRVSDAYSSTGLDLTRTTETLSEHSPESWIVPAGKPSGETILLSEPCPPSQRHPLGTTIPAAVDFGRLCPHTLQALRPSLADRPALTSSGFPAPISRFSSS
ncbi:hypothetical protein ATANTOWER_016954 [Ataeniobius toweri]|uniref:Uncharacterized protein n=1 Tax=Ataeniobius toweri TaxID=208326 RepID=A0ABU7C881_9TELE|nr:hypothetical protein [Ataeniobius toweri]